MSTTQTTFRPDERRPLMMVERIPWQYKWEAGQQQPEWLSLEKGPYAGTVTTDGWILNDNGVFVEENFSTSQTQEYWLLFAGTYENGFVAEVEINTESLSFRSWQGGICLTYGKSGNKANVGILNIINNMFALYPPWEDSMQTNPNNAKYKVPKETGYYKFRWGREINRKEFMMQTGGVRGLSIHDPGSYWGYVGLAPRYMKGGAVYVRSFKVYTY